MAGNAFAILNSYSVCLLAHMNQSKIYFSLSGKMVAQKRGRGAKNQANKAKANQPTEEVVATEVTEQEPEAAEENNGDSQPENNEEQATGEEAAEEQSETEQTQEDEPKAEELKEDKVESGKLLVENLPSSYLFDYQDKLKELFSKHGEVVSVK